MNYSRNICTFVLALIIMWVPALALEPTPWHKTALVTGNGYGFAVVSPEDGTVTAFYAHPYKFARPNPKVPLGEGIETTNFIKRMTWSGNSSPTAGTPVDYVNQSNIVTVGPPTSRQTFFMPFGLDGCVLIATSNVPGATALPQITWRHPIKAHETKSVFGCNIQLLTFKEIPETVALMPLVSTDKTVHGMALISLENPVELSGIVTYLLRWQAAQSPQQLVAQELKAFEAWRVKPQVAFHSDQERKLWRQSETCLRMAQIRESNNARRHSHGLIVACLPDSAWFMTWARDMAYCTFALIGMGHKQEARWAVEAYLNARPVGVMQKEVGNVPYQISVARYFGDGSEEPYFTEEGATNIEFDDWGLALYVLSAYVEQFGDRSFLNSATYRGSAYENAKKYIASPLLASLEPYKDGLIVAADTSIWEERQKDKKHFAFSTAAALAGLRGFMRVAQINGDNQFAAELQKKTELLQRGFDEAFVRSGRLTGTLEPGIKNDVDGATLNAILLGVTDDRNLMQATVAAMENLKMPSGGYRRVHSIVEDPKIFEYWYERQEFVFTDFALAQVLLRLGDADRANFLVESIVSKAADDHYFIPEMYVSEVNDRFKGPIGAPTGVVPIVSYGAAAFIDYILARGAAQAARRNSS